MGMGGSKGIFAIYTLLVMLLLVLPQFVAGACFPNAEPTYMKLSTPSPMFDGDGVPNAVSLEAYVYSIGTITILSPAHTAFLSGKTMELAGNERIGPVGVSGGLIIISWDYFDDSNPSSPDDGVCVMVSGDDGKNDASGLPYPKAGHSISYKATFCPYTKDSAQSKEWMANCAQLADSDGKLVTPLDWTRIDKCPGASSNDVDEEIVGGDIVDCSAKYLPSSDFASITNSTPTNSNAGFCWVLAFLFGLLASASYTMGKNPFQFLNPAIGRSVRMNRNAAYYRPMHQSVSIDPTAYLGAADKMGNMNKEVASDGENKDTKDAKAEQKDAKAELKDAKIPEAKASAGKRLDAANNRVKAAESKQPTFNQRMQGASQKGLVQGWASDKLKNLSDWAGDKVTGWVGLNDEKVDSAKEKTNVAQDKFDDAKKTYNSSPTAVNADKLKKARRNLAYANIDLQGAVNEANSKTGFWSTTLTNVTKNAVSAGITGVLLTPMAIISGRGPLTLKSAGSGLGKGMQKAYTGALRSSATDFASRGLKKGTEWVVGEPEELSTVLKPGQVSTAQYESTLWTVGDDLRGNVVADLENSGVADASDRVHLVQAENGQVLVTYDDAASGKTLVVAGTTNNATDLHETFTVDSFGKGNINIGTKSISPPIGGIEISSSKDFDKVQKVTNNALASLNVLPKDNEAKLEAKMDEFKAVDKTINNFNQKNAVVANLLGTIFNEASKAYNPFESIEPKYYLGQGFSGAGSAVGVALTQYLLDSSASTNQFMLSVMNQQMLLNQMR